MSSDPSNDNKSTDAGSGPDAHGQAAMLLVESLIHGLIERKVITVADAVEIVDDAADTQAEIARDHGASATRRENPLGLITAISVSLSRDLPYE